MPKSERIKPSRVISNPYHFMVENPRVHARAAMLLHGSFDLTDAGQGWVRASRFLPEQRQALTSCQAWYPGIFRQMARCSAGMTIEFETDCSFINIEVRSDAEPKAASNVFAGALDERLVIADPYVIEVDGQVVRGVLPNEPLANSLIKIDISALVQGVEEQDDEPLQLLPLMETGHSVRVWLPCLRGCELGDVYGEGSFIRPIAKRAQLLVLGDSVAQGFCAANAAENWPALVARERNFDLVNQSVGAQVFQYSSLAGLDELKGELDPEIIIVALGANYRWEPCGECIVSRAIQVYLEGLDELFPKAKLMVMLPSVEAHEPVAHSCYKQVPAYIQKAALKVRSKRVAEGRPALLISQTPELERELWYDEDGHPTSEGHMYLAEFVLAELDKLDCRCLAQFGKYGQCGSCVTALHEQAEAARVEPDDTAMDDEAVETNIDDADQSEDTPVHFARLMRLNSSVPNDSASEDSDGA